MYLVMAFQSQLIFPIKKCNGDFSKNKSDSTKKVNVKRTLFEKVSPSSCKKARQDENAKLTKSKEKTEASFVSTKQVFHTGQPSRIIGRSKEISEIENFLSDHISKRQAASLYISGAPGTGKTSCLMSVIENWKIKISYVFINCMSVGSPNDIYASIVKGFRLPSVGAHSKSIKSLEKYITSSTSMNVLVLDEIDHLDSKGQEVLYSVFEWPQLPNSSLILIGIANALDLTDRLLPRLHAFKYGPKIMHFQPYTRQQIVEILEARLSDSSLQVIKPVALELCARKIAATTGDIRKALDVCRRAIEVVQNKRLVLHSTSDDRCNPGSPRKGSSGMCVDMPDISAVLHEVYGSRLQSTTESSKMVTLPLQQMIVLCTLVLMKKHLRNQEMKLGRLYDIYRRICKKKDISAVAEWELTGLCKLLETRGLISLKPSEALRMTKVVLRVNESEAEYLLQDKAMLPSILSDKSVLHSI